MGENELRGLSRFVILAATLAVGLAAFSAPVRADGAQSGVLTCDVASGWGYVIVSWRDVKCAYKPFSGQPQQHYSGRISKFGVDIGYVDHAVIVWAVVTSDPALKPGGLSGTYAGVTGGGSFGIGAGANVLIGGSNNSISLQPVSVEGSMGINVAGGVATITLNAAP